MKTNRISDELKIKKLIYDDNRIKFKNKYETIEEHSIIYTHFFSLYKRYNIRRGIYLYEGHENMIDYTIGKVSNIDNLILNFINEQNCNNNYVKFNIDSQNYVHMCLMYSAYAYEFDMEKLLVEIHASECVLADVFPEFIKYQMQPLDIKLPRKNLFKRIKSIATCIFIVGAVCLGIEADTSSSEDTSYYNNEQQYSEEYYENSSEDNDEYEKKLYEAELYYDEFTEIYGYPPDTPVYIAPYSGTKFHIWEECEGLENAIEVEQITLDDAINNGYDLCGYEK